MPNVLSSAELFEKETKERRDCNAHNQIFSHEGALRRRVCLKEFAAIASHYVAREQAVCCESIFPKEEVITELRQAIDWLCSIQNTICFLDVLVNETLN